MIYVYYWDKIQIYLIEKRKQMSRLLFKDEHGVSTVVGALLLILIAVTAATGLAIMVSEMQKEEMERQSHITAVENEDLRVSAVDLKSKSPTWGSVNLTISNLNIDDSQLVAISVNDVYATNYTTNGKEYNLIKRLTILAAS